ncbi:MAG: LysR family transcriptional regulator [Peptococcaceae bacterium]|nr:LysR family transcriptional regulator [Peptococcaceae bacterium]
MRIEQLEYFLHVAHYGSLSLTANKINVGQPTLSAAIASFEKEIGRPLFRRTRRGMDLTPFGREILPLVEKTVDDYYDIKKKAGINTLENLHISLMATCFTSTILNEALFHTQSIFPKVSFTLHHDLMSNVAHSISDNKASIGLSAALDFNLTRHREYATSLNLRLMPQYNDNLCLCVKSGGYFQSLSTIRLDHLPEKVMMAVPQDLTDAGFIKSQSRWTALPKHLVFEDVGSLYQYIYRTDGIGVTSLLAVRNHPLFTSGLLKPVALSNTPINLVHYLTYPMDLALSDVEADIIQQTETYYEHLAVD